MSEVFKQLMAGLAKVKTLPVDDKIISPEMLAKGAEPLVPKAPPAPQPEKTQDE